jgi:hypothetical protein
MYAIHPVRVHCGVREGMLIRESDALPRCVNAAHERGEPFASSRHPHHSVRHKLEVAYNKASEGWLCD